MSKDFTLPKKHRPLEAILDSLATSKKESPGEDRVHAWLEMRHLELSAAIERGIQGLKDIDNLKAVNAEDMMYWKMAGGANAEVGAFPVMRIPKNLRRLIELSQDLAAVIQTRIQGLPKTTACICPKCKVITLRGVDGFYRCRGCGNHYTVTGGRWTRGLDEGFWGRYCFGERFKGMLESDTQEEISDRNNQ